MKPTVRVSPLSSRAIDLLSTWRQVFGLHGFKLYTAAMRILDQTRDSLADLPRLRQRMDLSSIARSILRNLIFAAVYLVSVKGSSAMMGLNPLVVTWCVTTMLLMPMFVGKSVERFEKRQNGWIAAATIWSVITFVLILANDPLWVKRMVSVFAVFQILYLIFWPILLGEKRLEKMIWKPHLFKKTRCFQIPASLVTFFTNEVAIWTDNDWIWIAAQTSCIFSIPLIYILVANITQARAFYDAQG